MRLLTCFTALCVALLTGACANLSAPVAKQSDYEREKRWAAEFESGIVVGEAIRLKQANSHAFVSIWAPQPTIRKAVLLVHSIGVHPDHGITGLLRSDLFDAGYSTLSIQAPIIDRAKLIDASQYVGLMPEAIERIQLGIRFLQQRGASQIFLVGHTSGAWMINEFFAASPNVPLAAWVSLGYTGRFGSFGPQQLATLDIYSERGSDWTRTRAPDRIEQARQLDQRSEQRYILNTDLSFAGQEKTVIEAIAAFFARF
jgi:hypothetical protein